MVQSFLLHTPTDASMCRCVVVSVERKYSTLIYLLLSFSLIFKWQISTRNIGWYLLTTKKKFILLIISGASFKKTHTHKNMKLRLTLQSTCLIEMCLEIKKGWDWFSKECSILFLSEYSCYNHTLC